MTGVCSANKAKSTKKNMHTHTHTLKLMVFYYQILWNKHWKSEFQTSYWTFILRCCKALAVHQIQRFRSVSSPLQACQSHLSISYFPRSDCCRSQLMPCTTKVHKSILSRAISFVSKSGGCSLHFHPPPSMVNQFSKGITITDKLYWQLFFTRGGGASFTANEMFAFYHIIQFVSLESSSRIFNHDSVRPCRHHKINTLHLHYLLWHHNNFAIASSFVLLLTKWHHG